MPWERTEVMMERQRFIDKYRSGHYSVSELAEEFGISRKTAHKLINRVEVDGLDGLCDRSRAPLSHPNRFDDEDLRALLLKIRVEHPGWGPRMIRLRLLLKDPGLQLPAASTIGELFKRHGLIKTRRRRMRSLTTAGRPTIEATAPNVRWDCDYKGDFLLGDASRCYPLTLTDGYSRLILGIRALGGTDYAGARRELERAFREYGLPETIRTDNGSPFAPFGGGAGLSRLTVWFIQLNVHHERTRPASPQDNSRHERMHRTLKADTTQTPGQTLSAQQRLFDEFRLDFNEDRPHQGLDDLTPASQYRSSPRAYPSRLPQPEYPGHWEKRMVDKAGIISFKGRRLYVGSAMIGTHVGLVEMDDGLWSVQFFNHELGRFNEADWKLR